MTNDDVSALSYEQALALLDQLIARLEQGSVDLDEAIACYERGATLVQRCAELLDRTEARVLQLVVGPGGREQERPFAPEGSDSGTAAAEAEGATRGPHRPTPAGPSSGPTPRARAVVPPPGTAGAELFPSLPGRSDRVARPEAPPLDIDPDDIPF